MLIILPDAVGGSSFSLVPDLVYFLLVWVRILGKTSSPKHHLLHGTTHEYVVVPTCLNNAAKMCVDKAAGAFWGLVEAVVVCSC